ncbi:hypothetical protein B1R94_21485 [Mycolicibacterium litorale]|nr:hypothetical protein B1R94_21485 [Mycolicibacterium litorale]
MTQSDSFPDDVPVADAVEQQRPAVPAPDPDIIDSDAHPPLESNESDWQEQRQVVDDPDEDEIR